MSLYLVCTICIILKAFSKKLGFSIMPAQKYQSRNQLIAYVLILLLAFGLRASVFDYGLPFVENVDAPNFYLLVNDNRGLLDAQWRNNLLAGYPPGYIWLYGRVLDIVDATGDYNVHTDQQYYTANMRLISVFASLITLSVLITSAQLLGGRTAGLIAGIVFAFSAEVIELSVLSLPDPATTMFMSLSALITIISFRKNSALFALLATIMALIAIAFKYPVVPILFLPASFFLMDLWRRRIQAIPMATLALLLVLSTAYYLLYINGGSSFDIAETRNFKGGIWVNLFSITQWQATLNLFSDVLGIPILFLGILSLTYPFIFKRQQKVSIAYWALLIAAMLLLGLIPLYLVRFSSVRYVYPAMALFTVILAVPQRYLTGGLKWLAVALICIFAFVETSQVIYRMNLPYTYVEAQFWVEENLPDESVVWLESHFMFRSISRYEAGYSGFNNYGLMYAPTITWREAEPYLDYVYLADYDLPLWDRDETRPALDEFLPIKQIDNTGYYGPIITIYDPRPFENRSLIVLEDSLNTLALRAYDLEQDSRSIHLMSYWQAPETQPTLDYSYVVYLTPLDDLGTVIYQQDASLGHRRTSTWTDPDELLRGDIAPIIIPDEIPSGSYQLYLGVYYWETGERMVFDDGNISLHIADIDLP